MLSVNSANTGAQPSVAKGFVVDIDDEDGNLTDRGFDLMTETAETIADDEADWKEYCEAHPDVWTEYFDEPFEADEETA